MPITLRTDSALARFLLLTVALLLSFAATQARSGTLADEDIKAVIATLKEMETVLGNAEHDEPEDEIGDDRDHMAFDFTSAYSRFVAELEKHPPTKEKMRLSSISCGNSHRLMHF